MGKSLEYDGRVQRGTKEDAIEKTKTPGEIWGRARGKGNVGFDFSNPLEISCISVPLQ